MMKVTANPYNKKLTGLEVKDWVWYNSHNQTRYSNIAKALMSCFNLDNNKLYMFGKNNYITQIVNAEESDENALRCNS
mgnify:CR=1 FL=1